MEDFQGHHGEDSSDKEKVLRKPDLLRQEKAKAGGEEGLNCGRPLLACGLSGPTRRLFSSGNSGHASPLAGRQRSPEGWGKAAVNSREQPPSPSADLASRRQPQHRQRDLQVEPQQPAL